MQPTEDRQVLEFEDFELDPRARSLRRNGQPIPITAKVFDALTVLARNHGRVVDKDELIRAIWPDTIVEEGNLHQCMSSLRRVLGEKSDERRFIATVPGRGYSFIPAVRIRGADTPKSHAVSRRWMILAVSVPLLILVGSWLWSSGRRQNRPARAVPLMAAPGFAASPTFSPDGRSVALSWRPEKDKKSHIYIKPISSTSLRQLTSGPYVDTAPKWSPDGRLIAFMRRMESRDELWHCIIPAVGGEPRMIFTAPGPASGIEDTWSSDGKQLIFAGRGSSDARARLYSFSVGAGQLRPLTDPPEGQFDLSPAVSPGGKSLAFLRTQNRGWSIIVRPFPDGEAKVILGPERDADRAALTWEPDGRYLIYRSTHGGLWEVPASGGQPRRLRVGGDSADFPAVSARGDLAFTESFQEFALKQIDRPEGGAAPTIRSVIESTRSVFDPQWSPDGKHIAFYSDRSGSTEIWRCDSSGEHLKQLTSFGGPFTRNPRWSPDGRYIAFDSVSNRAHVHIIPSGGGPDRILTSGDSTDIIPAWSHDGTTVYFTSLRDGKWQIWKFPAAGGAQSQVTFLGGFFPAVSADNYLYYVRAPGSKTLFRMRADGGAEQIVLDSALGYHSWWALVDGGIYFIDRNDGLRFFDLFSRRSTEVLAQFRVDELSPVTGLGSSPDGRSVLCPVITRSLSDVMLVERFWQ